MVDRKMMLGINIKCQLMLLYFPKIEKGMFQRLRMCQCVLCAKSKSRELTSSAAILSLLWYTTSPPTRSLAGSDACGSISAQDLDGYIWKLIFPQSENVLASYNIHI